MNRLTKKDVSCNYDFTYPNGEFVRRIIPNDKMHAEIYMRGLNKLGKLENLLEKYEIEDLAELEIALDQYYHRYDKVETRRVDNSE